MNIECEIWNFCMKQKTDTVWCEWEQMQQTATSTAVLDLSCAFLLFFVSLRFLIMLLITVYGLTQIATRHHYFCLCHIVLHSATHVHTHIPFPFQAAWYSHDDFNINRTSFSLKSVEENATQKEQKKNNAENNSKERKRIEEEKLNSISIHRMLVWCIVYRKVKCALHDECKRKRERERGKRKSEKENNKTTATSTSGKN